MDLSGFTIHQFKMWLDKKDDLPKHVIDAINQDERNGIKKAYEGWKNKSLRMEREYKRLNGIKQVDESYYLQGYKYVAGVDEAGRGPLAGPIVAAAVILPRESFICGINDSKKLSSDARKRLFVKICNDSISMGISLLSPMKIDELGIGEANKQVMMGALLNLKIKPEYVLIDGNNWHKPADVQGEGLIKGDSRSYCIAAASIVAKITRDNILTKISKKYPQYKFNQHKGYGTGEHIDMIRKHGLCPVHRKSFCHSII